MGPAFVPIWPRKCVGLIVSWTYEDQSETEISAPSLPEVVLRLCGIVSLTFVELLVLPAILTGSIDTRVHGYVCPWIRGPWIHGCMDTCPWIHGYMGPWICGGREKGGLLGDSPLVGGEAGGRERFERNNIIVEEEKFEGWKGDVV